MHTSKPQWSPNCALGLRIPGWGTKGLLPFTTLTATTRRLVRVRSFLPFPWFVPSDRVSPAGRERRLWPAKTEWNGELKGEVVVLV